MQGMHLNEIFENNLQIFTPEDSAGEQFLNNKTGKALSLKGCDRNEKTYRAMTIV